jgi:hypothetical protein
MTGYEREEHRHQESLHDSRQGIMLEEHTSKIKEESRGANSCTDFDD